jgi:probable F420-dependent oxidoreductase
MADGRGSGIDLGGEGSHMDLGRVGVWSIELRFHPDSAEIAEAAAELEELGYGALWTPGGVGGDILEAIEHLLASTDSVPVATGILNIWMHEPTEVAARFSSIDEDHPGRFLLGLGVSHAPLVNSEDNEIYRRPLAKMGSFLDALDAASPGVPQSRRALGSLGPKSLELAAARTRGAAPYFVPLEHTRWARDILGADALLAPEQVVLLETDADAARAKGRAYMESYLQLPNYVDTLMRFDFGEEDLRDGGSDRLVDAIVAWGDEGAIAERIEALHEAGADHVCIQVIGAPEGTVPIEQWRRLAPALVG